MLQELRWCQPLPAHPVLSALASQAMTAGQVVLTGDAAVHRLQQAHVARAFGDPNVRSPLAAALAGARSGFLACEILRHFPGDAPDQAVSAAEEYLRADQEQAKTLAAMVHLRLAERHLLRQALPGAVDPLIRLAEAELEMAGRPSRWLAEFNELRGRIAQRQSDWDGATREFQSAVALQLRLGNAAAVDVIGTRLATAKGEGGELVMTGGPEPARELVVRYLPSRPPNATRGLVADVDAMQSALELAIDNNEALLAAGGVVRIEKEALLTAGAVVRIESPEPEVLGQPWELVADRVYRTQPPVSSQKRDTTWLRWVLETQRGRLNPDLQERCFRVVSGQEILSQSVREKMELVLKRADPKRRVVIVKGSEQAEASWQYSSRARGLNLKSSYLSAGWDVDELTTAQVQQAGLRSLLARRPPTVIHLSARMEMSGTLSWFDTSEEDLYVRGQAKAGGTDTGIFTTHIIEWLKEMNQSFGAAGPPPVVVLDPVDAPNPGATVDLLVGRNRFAAGVYLDGLTMAVVATGLAGRDPLALQQAWLSGVKRGDSLEEVVHDMRRTADPDVPPALFAPSRTFTIT
jgi:hypothetical protein